MKIEYYNLYTHFILITQNRIPLISEHHRERIEKYIKKHWSGSYKVIRLDLWDMFYYEGNKVGTF